MRRLFYNDDEFSQAFHSLRDYREVPPVGNWRAINAKLDKRKAYRYTGVVGAVTVLSIVVGLGLSIYFSTEPARLRTQALKHESLTRPPLAAEPVIARPSARSQPNVDAVLDNTKVSGTLENVNAALAIMDVRPHDVIKPLRAIRRTAFMAPLKTLDYHAYEMLTGSGDVPVPTEIKDEVVSAYVCRPFYVGVNIQPQHTMLAASNVVDNPNVGYKFSPGLAYGVSAGYRLSSAWSLETGGMLSMENNRYEAVREQQAKKAAKVNTTPDAQPLQQYKLALSYYRIPLMVKFRMPWNPKRRSICEESVSMIGGVQYGYFRNGFNSSMAPNGDTQNSDVVTEDIKRSDVQVLTGVERSSAVSQHFSLNYGFRVGYGLRQISSLETERVTRFQNPHNLSAAFNVALTFSK